MGDLKKIFQKPELGVLIIRMMMGVVFIGHGVLHMMGKNAGLEDLGKTLQAIGIQSAPFAWGVTMSILEVFVGGCLIIGFYMRVAIFLGLFITVPLFMTALQAGAGFSAIIDFYAFRDLMLLPLLFIGSGAYSYDKS